MRGLRGGARTATRKRGKARAARTRSHRAVRSASCCCSCVCRCSFVCLRAHCNCGVGKHVQCGLAGHASRACSREGCARALACCARVRVEREDVERGAAQEWMAHMSGCALCARCTSLQLQIQVCNLQPEVALKTRSTVPRHETRAALRPHQTAENAARRNTRWYGFIRCAS